MSAAPTFVRAPRAAPGAATVASWLLRGPAQLAHGRHAGAVAGTVTDAGIAAYVYPEIAGYYLQWLAWRARCDGRSIRLCERAAAVQRWLGVWLADTDPPATRTHLDGTVDDWRNRAVFCFDVAMVLRGMGSAASASLLTPDPVVIEGVVRQLERMIAPDGAFDACAMTDVGDAFAAKWSTRRGAFLTKAAAGVLTAARALPGIPGRVVRAADATFGASMIALAQSPHREAHPLLYACEGILALPGDDRFADGIAIVAEQFEHLLAAANADGYLRETLGAANSPQRVDVVAQALRVGHLLRAHRPQQPPDRVALERLARALHREIRPDGAVAFARGADGSLLNVWAAMFADQAIAFAAPPARVPGHSEGAWGADPLLV